jgi:hypothetical protein
MSEQAGASIADSATGVSDEAWANGAKRYDAEQLATLVCLIAFPTAYNRMHTM